MGYICLLKLKKYLFEVPLTSRLEYAALISDNLITWLFYVKSVTLQALKCTEGINTIISTIKELELGLPRKAEVTQDASNEVLARKGWGGSREQWKLSLNIMT